MSESFKPRPVGGGYVNSVSLRFNPNDIPALTELGINYTDLTPDSNYDCRYLHFGITFWDNFQLPVADIDDLSSDAQEICGVLNAAATFCDW